MNYKVAFGESFVEDLSTLAMHEVRFVFSLYIAYDHLDVAVDEIRRVLSTFPARNPEKPYGFTEALRRKLIVGKYTAFHWLDEAEGIVHVERILHSKADFTRIHFDN